MSNHSFEYLQTFENLHLINQPLNEVKNILYQFFYFRKSGFPHTHQTHRDQPTQLREAQALPQWWSFTLIWIEAGDNSSRVTRQVQNRSRVTTSPGCLPELPAQVQIGVAQAKKPRILTVIYHYQVWSLTSGSSESDRPCHSYLFYNEIFQIA